MKIKVLNVVNVVGKEKFGSARKKKFHPPQSRGGHWQVKNLLNISVLHVEMK